MFENNEPKMVYFIQLDDDFVWSVHSTKENAVKELRKRAEVALSKGGKRFIPVINAMNNGEDTNFWWHDKEGILEEVDDYTIEYKTVREPDDVAFRVCDEGFIWLVYDKENGNFKCECRIDLFEKYVED